MSGTRGLLALALVLGSVAWGQRPDEGQLFGAPDAGTRPARRSSSEELLRGLPPPKAGKSKKPPSRPDEETLFSAPAPDAGTQSPVAPEPKSQEARGLDTAQEADAFATGAVKEDPLKIGGQFYVRGFLGVSQDQPFNESRFSLPTLVDVYLDARPTDRLRAFVLGRLTYDPFLSASVGGTPVPGLPVSTSVSNPGVVLDQAWLAFDIARSVFVTVGRQHVRWGTAHFFTPTDFLASQPRDPLAVFDARLGVSMVRAQVPWEAAGWNFTAVALFEPTQNVGGGYSGSGAAVENPTGSGINPTGTSGTTLRDVGGAFRAEFAFKQGSFGIDGLVQRNRKSRVGADFTMALGDIDLYGEVAVKDGLDTPTSTTLQITTQTLVPPNPVIPGNVYVTTTKLVNVVPPAATSPVIQAAGGASYSLNLEGNRSLTFGGEYFYNSASFQREEYLELLLAGAFQPFYVGKHYLALNATLLDTTARTTWVLTGIGNLSDQTYVARLDFIVTVLSYLSVETYVAGHFGRTGGEFRLGFPRQTLGSVVGKDNPDLAGDPVLNLEFGPIHPPILEVGVGLRLAI